MFLRSLPVRVMHHALEHFRAGCPQTQPSIITAEFYISQLKEALDEAIHIKVGFIKMREPVFLGVTH